MVHKEDDNGRVSLFIFYLITFVIIAYLINIHGIQRLKEYINQMGIFAPLGIMALRSTSIVIPALPSTAYSILSGALLGFKNGLATICISDFLSCSLCFYIARKYGRNLVKSLIREKFMHKIESISKKHLENNFFLMTGFLMTGLFDFISYGIGLTKTPWKKFAPALAISIMLSNPPIVAIGAGILEGGRRIIILGLFGIFILSLLSNRLSKKQN